MKEAIGSTWLLIIVMLFIALFSGFLAFSINYSRAFRVKDGIVERIEKHNGFNTDAMADISSFLKEIGYNGKGSCSSFMDDEHISYAGITKDNVIRKNPNANEIFNYCVQRVNAHFRSEQNVVNSTYYKVIVFFSLNIGSIQAFSKANVTGATITLYYANDNIFG